MFRSFITIAAVAGLAAGASAQQQMPAVSLQPVSNLQYGSYDFNNGFTVTNGGNRAIGPDTLFDSTGNVAYYYGVVGADTTKQEWMDETQLPNRGATGSEQITGMAWIYCEGGYTAYFDAYVSLYNDTVACAGSSSWSSGVPSFADCVYGVGGLPGSGCWIVTIDLSCGFECVLPDASNPLSGAQGTIGWSVTPVNCNGSPFLGPFLGRQADAAPGSQDLFEWRDWSGAYFGSYIHGGCYWFGGIPHARADFHVAFYGAAVDVQNCYANPALAKDTLCLELTAQPAVGSGISYVVSCGSALTGGVRLYANMEAPISGVAGCEQASMGSWTRQVALPGTLSTGKSVAAGPNLTFDSFGVTGSTTIPVPGSMGGKRLVLQAIQISGGILAASNGVYTGTL